MQLPEALLQKPDAVLFDLDNTLYAYEPAHDLAMVAVETRCNASLGLDSAAFKALFDEARKEVKTRLGHQAASHSRLLYFQRVIERAAGKANPALTLELEKTYWRRFMSAASLFPGARDLLGELRFAGIPLLLVTDLTAQIQLRKLVFFELEHAFDQIVTSEEAGADKPDARPYRLALEKAGLPASGRYWMIGDSPERDIVGAQKAVGALGIQKVHHGVPRSNDATLVVTDLQAFAEAIRVAFNSAESHPAAH